MKKILFYLIFTVISVGFTGCGANHQEVIKIYNNKNIYNTVIYSNGLMPVYPNAAGGIDVKLSYINLSSKTIKYIYFDVTAYNDVEDITVSTISNKATASLRVIGPIHNEEVKNGQFSNVWYNSTISGVKLNQIRIEYMDKSTHTIEEKDISKIFGKTINPIWQNIHTYRKLNR